MTKFLSTLAVFVTAAVLATGVALARDTAAGAGPTTKLEIRHVRKGCHVWIKDGVATTSLRLTVRRGARLQVRNQDMKPHELAELSGHKLALEGHMMPGMTQVVTFTQRGVYRFKTRTLEMGAPMTEETIGPDNALRLKVRVR